MPALLKRVLAEDSWREFVTRRDERVTYDRFADFVTAKPLAGLGADMALIERLVGTGDPELLLLLKDAKAGKRGRPRGGSEKIDDSSKFPQSHTADDLARLANDAPEEYAAVQRGEKTINAAAVSAGIRKRRVSVRLDSAESAAETLRKHMAPGELARLRDLLGK